MTLEDYFHFDCEYDDWGGSYITLTDKQTNEVIFEWNNNANVDYPEDLTWGRMIGDLFKEAFELGQKYS